MLTGKGLNWGGSLIRPEATGYGAVYFTAEMLATRNETLEGKTCLVSGSGNVAQYTIEKLIDLGAKAVTVSDSDGYIYDEAGFDREKLAFLMELKNVRRGRIREYADRFKGVAYTPLDANRLDFNPLWMHRAQCAFPSATQNEINAKDAATPGRATASMAVAEGANMPCTPEAAQAADRWRRALRARQGRERRRRRDVRSGDGAEQRAHCAGRARKSTAGCTGS